MLASHLIIRIEDALMLLGLGIGLSFFGIGALCSLLFSVAIYALPCAAGFWTFLTVYHMAAGPFGAIIAGLAVGALTFAAGQYAFTSSRGVMLRSLVALIFAVPAAVAGYSVSAGLAGIGISSHAWVIASGIIGGLTASVTAWIRLSAGIPPMPRETSGADHKPLPLSPRRLRGAAGLVAPIERRSGGSTRHQT